MTNVEQVQKLTDLLNDGKISRAQFVKRTSALGLTVGALGTLLAACGGDDSASSEPAAPAAEDPPADDPPAEDSPAEEPPTEEPSAEEPPAEEPSAGAAISTADVDATGLAVVETDAGNIAVANVEGEYFAFDDTCTHQGCSLATGTLAGSSVICPCHGSTFNVTTGEVVAGPASEPVGVYTVTVNGEELAIEFT